MTDLALQQLPDGSIDLCLFGGDLMFDDSIRSAVMVSLLSDREWPDAVDGDRRGWWGDVLLDDPGDRIGSWLWRLNRRKAEPSALVDAKQYAEQCLKWLTDDGIARSVTVIATWDAMHRLQLDIDVAQPGGVLKFRLAEMWQANFGPSAQERAAAVVSSLAQSVAALQWIYYQQWPEISYGGE